MKNTRRARHRAAFGVASVALGLVLSCSSTPRSRAEGEPAQQPVSQGSTGSAAADTPSATDPQAYARLVQPFLDEHCYSCHGETKAKGDLRLTELPNDFADPAAKQTWAEVVDMLNSHQMPPDTEPEPEPDRVAAVVDWITDRFTEADMKRRESAIVLRRLNRAAYRNTLQALTGVEVDVSDIPEDGSEAGFDNIGSALTTSPLHLESYLAKAQEVLDRALADGPRPTTHRWHFEAEQPKGFAPMRGSGRVFVDHFRGDVEGGFRVLNAGAKRNFMGIRNFALPSAGEYIVRVRAGGHSPSRADVLAAVEPILAARRDQRGRGGKKKARAQARYDEQLAHFRTSPIYDYGPPRLAVKLKSGGRSLTMAEVDVVAPVDKPEVYEFKAHFGRGGTLVRLRYAYEIPSLLENGRVLDHEQFVRPSLWVDWYELEGPVYDAWPPASRKRVLGQEVRGEPDAATVQAILSRFMRRAYRRPVVESEVQGMMALYTQARGRRGSSFLQAIKLPLTAVLVSPHFLFMVEATGGKPGPGRPLGDHELASRLSYFLWSSMPDEALSALADGGKLNTPDQLAAQVDRMLADPRSSAFVTEFAGQWLGLREVGLNPPVPELYPRYNRHLEDSIVREGEAFFDTVLRNDLSLTNFIRSDFLVINERLARFYGVPGVKGDHFRKVPLPAGLPRGGVATQAAMLTVTSNGTRTSPVKRGAWIMKTLLGMDPGLPVSNAGEISPRVPGIDRATVRQRLEAHRTLPQCARCHDRMDPLGFALENFNAAGEWREREGTGWRGLVRRRDPEINASARLPDGTEFTGVGGLQRAMLEKKGLVLRCIASKLMTYALGRELTLADQRQVQAAVQHMEREGDNLRSLLKFIVRSEPFRRK